MTVDELRKELEDYPYDWDVYFDDGADNFIPVNALGLNWKHQVVLVKGEYTKPIYVKLDK